MKLPSAGPWPSTTELGRRAESAAAEHLERHDLEIVARNDVAGGAELDIVAREQMSDGTWTYVFVEVRAREATDRGHPLETIGRAKRRRLIHGASAWLVERDMWERVAVRFDVCAVRLGEPMIVEWVRAAFDRDG